MRSRGWCRSRIALWAFAAGAIGSSVACRPKEEVLATPYTDNFDRPDLGPTWRDTGGGYRLIDGKLAADGAYNHPAWLRKRLPPDVSVEFDAQARTDVGDIKIELFGDGESFDPDRGSYQSTGYVLIFGGWNNSLSVICRIDEHDAGRKVSRSDRRVEKGRSYHFAIQRKGGHIDWTIDGTPFLAWTDPDPLTGNGHEYFAVNNWEAGVLFDNVSITPVR